MKVKVILLFGIFLAVFGLTWLSLGVQAAPSTQAGYSTPTPGSDGRIIYIVQQNDTCLRIQLLTGVPVETIRSLNKLDEACTIQPNQQLIIGFASTATPGPTATEGILATPTSTKGGAAEVCVALYNDINGDGKRQANTDAFDNYLPNGTEPTVAGGAVSLTSLDGMYSKTADTLAGYDPVCFTEVPRGEYTVSAAVPDGYNPTTLLTYSLTVIPGDIVQVPFGIQEKSSAPESQSQPAPSPLLGVGGALFIIGGIGLAIFALKMKKRR